MLKIRSERGLRGVWDVHSPSSTDDSCTLDFLARKSVTQAVDIKDARQGQKKPSSESAFEG